MVKDCVQGYFVDGTHTIFLSTKVKNKEAVPKELDAELVSQIVRAADEFAPEYDANQIYEKLKAMVL